jgi:hypothetical protein
MLTNMIPDNTSTPSSTTTTTTTNQSPGVKKKRGRGKKITKQNKQWTDHPTSDLLLESINDTFISKVKNSLQLPINDFINHYSDKLDKGWLEPIVGNLDPFITFLSSSFTNQVDNTKTKSITFFESNVDELMIESNHQQTKDDLLTAVRDSFDGTAVGDPHPITVFLMSDHELKKKYNGDDWLLYFLGSKEAGKKQKKLEYNVRIITTILYSIICTTCDKNTIDILALSLGANATKPDRRRRYLNAIAHRTIKEYDEIQHTGDDATARTTSLSQSSATNTDGTTASTASLSQSSGLTVADTDITPPSLPHHRQAPTVITTNIENGLSNFNDNDNISPLTVPPSSTTTTSSFSFRSSLNDTLPDWDDMSVDSHPSNQQNTLHDCDNMSFGSPPPKQQNTPHDCDDISFGSPTPKQATKKIRAGPTPNMNTPSNKGNRRVLFTDELLSRVTTTTSRARATTTDRIRGGGDRNASSSNLVTIDLAKFKDDTVVRNYAQRFEKATNIKQLVNGAVDFLSSIASSNNSNIASVTSQYNMLLKVAKPRKLKDDTKPSSRRRYIRKKSKEMHNVISAAIPDSDIRKDVMSNILKRNYGADIYFDEVKQRQVSVQDCIAIRMRGGHGISNSAANKMLQDVVRLFTHNNMLRVKHPLPGSLRAKMGKAEGIGYIPVDHEMIMCSTGKDKFESCLHYFIRKIPLLVEKLVASCMLQDQYEDSILFSSLINRIGRKRSRRL